MGERREAFRVRVAVPVLFHDDEGCTTVGETVDISMKGIRCDVPVGIREGAYYCVSVFLAFGDVLEGCAHVVHVKDKEDGRRLFGVSFVAPSSGFEKRLKQFIMDEQRSEAARIRFAKNGTDKATKKISEECAAKAFSLSLPEIGRVEDSK